MRQVFIIAVNFEMCLACVDLSSSRCHGDSAVLFKRPFKKRQGCGRLAIVVGKKRAQYTQANGTLLSEARLCRTVDTLYSHGRVTGVIFPRQRQEKRDRTKWNPSLWTRHARQELRNDRDFARGSMRRIGARKGAARDTQRPVGIICTSLEWRWLRLVGICANSCHIVRQSRAVDLQADTGL